MMATHTSMSWTANVHLGWRYQFLHFALCSVGMSCGCG